MSGGQETHPAPPTAQPPPHLPPLQTSTHGTSLEPCRPWVGTLRLSPPGSGYYYQANNLDNNCEINSTHKLSTNPGLSIPHLSILRWASDACFLGGTQDSARGHHRPKAAQPVNGRTKTRTQGRFRTFIGLRHFCFHGPLPPLKTKENLSYILQLCLA